jgi:sorbitol-specific phosphotransferase system component IIC
MQQDNPYSTPKSDLDKAAESDDDIASLNRLASGQRLLIVAVAVSILSSFLMGANPVLAGVIGITASVIGVVGVVRLTRAMGRSTFVRLLYSIAILLPLINLLVMLLLSSQATDRLRAGGYKVGFFGAKQQHQG